MKISDEIRQWCDICCDDYIDKDCCDELRELANRIDAETVELPKDADGVLIRIGDMVYDNHGVAWTVVGLRRTKFEWKVETNDVPFLWKLDDLSHKKPEPPDSWERIADDIEAAQDWCDSKVKYGTGITSVKESTLLEWSDRIRKLAKEEE